MEQIHPWRSYGVDSATVSCHQRFRLLNGIIDNNIQIVDSTYDFEISLLPIYLSLQVFGSFDQTYLGGRF